MVLDIVPKSLAKEKAEEEETKEGKDGSDDVFVSVVPDACTVLPRKQVLRRIKSYRH